MINKTVLQQEKREIEKAPAAPQMFPELINALSDLCFAKDKKQHADLLFVFGSNIIQQQLAKKICDILEEGIVKKVIITGGIASYEHIILQPIPESEQILSYIPTEKFKDVIFIKEEKSKNSLENVLEANLIYDFNKDEKIIFMSHSYASMRSKLTLKKICPDKKLISQPYDIPTESKRHPISKKYWWKTIYGQAVVWGEYLRFIKYGERKDIPTDEVFEKLENIKRILAQKNY
jgi:uncharacterized SAM-binding protein YcdF (DUF218 family)